MTEQPNAAATAEDRGALVRRSRIRRRRARRVPLLAPGSAGRWLGRLCGLAAIRRIALTDYPASFEPNQKLVVSVRLPMVLLPLQPGSDPSLVHDFGGKPLVDHNGTGMFAELAIQQMAEAAGWSARWVCTYGMKAHVPRFLTTWSDLPLDEQENVPLDAKQELLLRRIARRTTTRTPVVGMSWRGRANGPCSSRQSTTKRTTSELRNFSGDGLLCERG